MKNMKILHICLAAAYVEGFGYQENILTQMHAEMGNEVVVLTAYGIFNSKAAEEKCKKNDYINDFGIRVKFLQKSTRYGYYSRFRDFDGVYDALQTEVPDIIFVHGGQFVALKDVIQYCKRHRTVRLFIDQHGDYYNMKVNTWKEKLVHHWIYGHWMRMAVKYTEKFWGVTPWRCQFLREVYHIPENKIGLLVLGGDDRYIDLAHKAEIRQSIREQLSLQENDFIVITGGKIDVAKNINLLMQAVGELNFNDLKLIVFGQADEEMAPVIEKLSKDPHIRNIGWLDSAKVYDYFLASDLAVFPGTHSVLWEQACACGIPGLFKDWEGMHHVNIHGSADFLHTCTIEEIKTMILQIYENKEKYNAMKTAAQTYAVSEFSYRKIARRAVNMNENAEE